jgi:phosphate transport system ATP-binding protein
MIQAASLEALTLAPEAFSLMSVPSIEPALASREPKVQAKNVEFFYGAFRALKGITFDIPANQVTALIGPSGCGKSTFLRCINRMNDLIEGTKLKGQLLIDKVDIYGPTINPVDLRKHIGMVFQKPNPFPVSIYDNVAYGPRIHGTRKKSQLDEIVEQSLKRAALWDEVKDKIRQSALALSGGQQQRLCIARTIAVQPNLILMDEPCSALDPIATAKIEELIYQLRQEFTIVLVTHNMQQAQRTSDFTAFFMMGELVEFSETQKLFMTPQKRETEDYVSGRFG